MENVKDMLKTTHHGFLYKLQGCSWIFSACRGLLATYITGDFIMLSKKGNTKKGSNKINP